MSQFFRNSKDAVPVCTPDNLKRHGSGTVNRVLVAAGGTETAFASEGNEFILTAGTAAIHSTTKGRVTTVEHTVNVFHDSGSGVCSIKYFFIMISDDSL